MCLTTIPCTSGDRHATVIIPRGITQVSVLGSDLDLAMAFTLEAFSVALVGVAGAGDRTGSIARLIRILTFSIITAMRDAGIELLIPGRTIRAIGLESPIRIVRSFNATAEFHRLAANPVSDDLADNLMRRKQADGIILARGVLPARVRNAATAPVQPIIVEAADTIQTRQPAAAIAETALCPAIAPAQPITEAVATAQVRPPAAVPT